MEMENRLEGGLAVTDEEVDPLAAHVGASQGSCHLVTDRPDVSARGCVEVFQADRVLAWHDEKMAGCDRFRSMNAMTVSSS